MENKLKRYLLIALVLWSYVLILIVFFLTPSNNAFNFVIRLCGLFGFLSISITIIVVPFAAKLYKMFGKSFIKIHHSFALIGIVLITIHPIALLLFVLDPTIFLPNFSDWLTFWRLAGRPSLILIYIGVLSAVLRKKIPKYWKQFHMILYIAFIFGFVHGILIGTDLKNPLMIVIFIGLFVVVSYSFALKRYQIYRIKQKKRNQKLSGSN
jgi:DMSO/TMAO reductase YedYZ heme-binding membrane subunit